MILEKRKGWFAGVILCAIILLSGALGYEIMFGGLLPTAAASPTGSNFNYVLTIIMENQNNGSIFGNSCCPYETSLAKTYSLASAYYDIYSPSLPDYIALTSGSTQGITDDNGPSSHPLGVTNVVDRLTASGLTWKAYMESMPSPCYQSDSGSQGTYYVRHDPFVYYTDITGNSGSGTMSALCQSHVVSSGGSCPNGASSSQILTCDSTLLGDLNATSGWPNYMWLTPNGCNDMHDCSTSTGDKYLASLIPKILSSSLFNNPANKAALFLVWDEYHPTPGAVWAGSVSKTGYRSSITYNHYSAIRTIENNWGLATLSSGDGAASPMTEFFGTSSATPDFGLTASPSSVSFTTGGTGSSTITMTPLNGFVGTVMLSASSPTGITTSCSQLSLTRAALTSTCYFSATSAASGTVTIIGTSGTVTHSASVAVSATASGTPGFVLGASPASVTFTTGSTGSSTITLSPLNGFAGSVTLAATSPAGITTNCLPGTITNTAVTSSCTFSAASAASGTVTISGTSGTIIHSANITVTATPLGTVNFDPAQWSLSSNSPSTTVISSGTLQETVIDTATSYTGNNYWATAQYLKENGFSGPPLPVSTFSAHVNIMTATTSSTYVYHAYMGLYFTLPSAVSAGGLTTNLIDGQVQVEYASSSGWKPAGSSYTSNLGNRFGYREIMTTQGANSSFDFVNYDVQAFCARAEAAWGIPSTPCTLVRVEPGIEGYGVNPFSVVWTTFSANGTASSNFSLSANPTSVSMVQGKAGTSSITLASLNSFAGVVTLSGVSSLSSVTVTINPTAVALISGGTGSTSLAISTTSSTPAGTYSVTIIATAGSLSHSARITVTVVLPPDFGLASSPSSISIPGGSSGYVTLTLTSLNGFSGSLTLTTAPLMGFVLSISPTVTTLKTGGQAYSALTISPSSTVSSGTYTVSVTGIGVGLSHSITVTIVVTPSVAQQLQGSISWSPTSPAAGQTVDFTASATNGLQPYHFVWSFGDGSTSAGATVSHAYSSSGNYTVGLAVIDVSNITVSSQKVLTVGTNSPLPVIFAVPGAETASPGSMLTFTVNASNPGAPGLISITASNLPPGASFTSTPGNPASGTFTWNPSSVQPGSYTVTFNAAQAGSSYSASRTVTIDVASAPSNRCFFCWSPWLWPAVSLAMIGATIGLVITVASADFVRSHRGRTRGVPPVRLDTGMPARVSVTPLFRELRTPHGTRISLAGSLHRPSARKATIRKTELRPGRSSRVVRRVSRKRSSSE